MLLALIAGLVLVLWFLYDNVKKPKGYPPGPVWLPVVGCFPLFHKQLVRLGYCHKVWSWLSERYGSIVGLRLGSDQIVLVFGYEAIRDVLARDDFDGRPDGFFFRLRTFGERLGIVFSDGPFWHEQRRFCLQHLRQFGFGKRDMEAHIEAEATDLVESLRGQCNEPLLMHDAFDVCVLNSLWAMLAGKRFALDDKRLVELLDIVHTSFRMMDMSGGLLNQMPFLRYIAPDRIGYNQLFDIITRMMSFLRETVSEHRANYNNEDARDLIDSFLHEMETQVNNENSTFTENQLLSLCLDLFMAGSETTSNTLGFAILYMLLYPEVQSRVQEELDSVIGRDRQPTFRDRTLLSYVEAVLMEVQRIAVIVPVAVPHRALRDTVLMGYNIPQGSTLLINICSLHMDPGHWGDPEVFRPERFLENGKIVQDDWFIPFGYGRRRCLGESLAKSSLFIFFSSILHNFTLSVPPGKPAPSTDGFDGVTLSPRPFYAKLTPRG